VLCRNLAFSYFDEPPQRSVAAQVREVMRTGAALVVGLDERHPTASPDSAPLAVHLHRDLTRAATSRRSATACAVQAAGGIKAELRGWQIAASVAVTSRA
jgi:hypothetical protein